MSRDSVELPGLWWALQSWSNLWTWTMHGDALRVLVLFDSGTGDISVARVAEHYGITFKKARRWMDSASRRGWVSEVRHDRA